MWLGCAGERGEQQERGGGGLRHLLLRTAPHRGQQHRLEEGLRGSISHRFCIEQKEFFSSD